MTHGYTSIGNGTRVLGHVYVTPLIVTLTDVSLTDMKAIVANSTFATPGLHHSHCCRVTVYPQVPPTVLHPVCIKSPKVEPKTSWQKEGDGVPLPQVVLV